jgi:hypothetical protein
MRPPPKYVWNMGASHNIEVETWFLLKIKTCFVMFHFDPSPPLLYNLYGWKLMEANNVAIKNEGLLIMPYEIHGEHRDTCPSPERNYTTLILPMDHINNLLPKWWVTHSDPDRHPHCKLKVIIHHCTN